MDVRTVDDLIDVLQSPSGAETHSKLKRAWTDGSLLDWLETRTFHFGQPDDALLKRIQALSERLSGNAELGLFALLQTLQPGRPLELLPGVALEAPDQIAPLFAANSRKRRDLLAALSQHVVNGKLAEWLQASDFPGWQGSVGRLRRLPNPAVRGVEHLPGYAARWQYDNRAPFPTGDMEATDPAALAAWIDASAEHRRIGATLLDSGWLDLWLELTGRLSEKGSLQALRDAKCSEAAKLELLLRRLDPARPVPELRVEPARLDLGKLAPGAVVQRRFTVSARGSGHVWGTAALQVSSVGMRLEPLDFDGAPAHFTFHLDTSGVPPFTQRTAQVELRCNDGRGERVLRLPVRYAVRVPVSGAIGRSLLAGIAAGGLMALLRLWAGSTINGPGAADRRLDWVPVEWVANTFDRSFGDFVLLLLMAVALISAVGGGIAYLVGVCRR